MTTGHQLQDFAAYSDTHDPETVIADLLGDDAPDFDAEGLTDAYRDGINALLDEVDIEIHGRVFYSRVHPAHEQADELIRDAIRNADIGVRLDEFAR